MLSPALQRANQIKAELLELKNADKDLFPVTPATAQGSSSKAASAGSGGGGGGGNRVVPPKRHPRQGGAG